MLLQASFIQLQDPEPVNWSPYGYHYLMTIEKTTKKQKLDLDLNHPFVSAFPETAEAAAESATATPHAVTLPQPGTIGSPNWLGRPETVGDRQATWGWGCVVALSKRECRGWATCLSGSKYLRPHRSGNRASAVIGTAMLPLTRTTCFARDPNSGACE